MTVTWVAQVTEKSGRLSNYHLYERDYIPPSRFWLIEALENAARYAHAFFGLKEFALQCWKVPEVRKFHRSWLMQFDIEFSSAISNRVNIKSASFDITDKSMWMLKEDFQSGGKFKSEPEPRIIDPEPNLMSVDTSTGGSMFNLRSGRRSLHSRVSETSGGAPHGPVIRARLVRPTFRRPLIKHWKETIGSAHSSSQ